MATKTGKALCSTGGCGNRLVTSDTHHECLYCLTEDHFVEFDIRSCPACCTFSKRAYYKRLERRAGLLTVGAKRSRSASPDRARSKKRASHQRRDPPPSPSYRAPLLPPKERSSVTSGTLPPPKGDPIQVSGSTPPVQVLTSSPPSLAAPVGGLLGLQSPETRVRLSGLLGPCSTPAPSNVASVGFHGFSLRKSVGEGHADPRGPVESQRIPGPALMVGGPTDPLVLVEPPLVPRQGAVVEPHVAPTLSRAESLMAPKQSLASVFLEAPALQLTGSGLCSSPPVTTALDRGSHTARVELSLGDPPATLTGSGDLGGLFLADEEANFSPDYGEEESDSESEDSDAELPEDRERAHLLVQNVAARDLVGKAILLQQERINLINAKAVLTRGGHPAVTGPPPSFRQIPAALGAPPSELQASLPGPSVAPSPSIRAGGLVRSGPPPCGTSGSSVQVLPPVDSRAQVTLSQAFTPGHPLLEGVPAPPLVQPRIAKRGGG